MCHLALAWIIFEKLKNLCVLVCVCDSILSLYLLFGFQGKIPLLTEMRHLASSELLWFFALHTSTLNPFKANLSPVATQTCNISTRKLRQKDLGARPPWLNSDLRSQK